MWAVRLRILDAVRKEAKYCKKGMVNMQSSGNRMGKRKIKGIRKEDFKKGFRKGNSRT